MVTLPVMVRLEAIDPVEVPDHVPLEKVIVCPVMTPVPVTVIPPDVEMLLLASVTVTPVATDNTPLQAASPPVIVRVPVTLKFKLPSVFPAGVNATAEQPMFQTAVVPTFIVMPETRVTAPVVVRLNVVKVSVPVRLPVQFKTAQAEAASIVMVPIIATPIFAVSPAIGCPPPPHVVFDDQGPPAAIAVQTLMGYSCLF